LRRLPPPPPPPPQFKVILLLSISLNYMSISYIYSIASSRLPMRWMTLRVRVNTIEFTYLIDNLDDVIEKEEVGEEEEEEEKKKEEEKIEEENTSEDLKNPSPSSPLEYPEEEILFEIINQLNFIYLLNTLIIGQEHEEEEKE